MLLLILGGLGGFSLLYAIRQRAILRAQQAAALAAAQQQTEASETEDADAETVSPEEVTSDQGQEAESIDELSYQGSYDQGETAESVNELAYDASDSVMPETPDEELGDPPQPGEIATETPQQQTAPQAPPVNLPGKKPAKPKDKPKAPPKAPVAPISLTKKLKSTKAKSSVLKPAISLPSLPWLRDRENAEPGFMQAIVDLANEFGGNADRIAAYMSKRSDFNPEEKMKCPTYPGGRITAFRCGFGIWGFVDKDLSNGAKASNLPGALGGIAQVTGPLRELFARYPKLASDPAAHVLLHVSPEWIGKPDDTIVVKQPYWSPFATTQDEHLWQELGDMDKSGNGVVTMGELRAVYYDRLKQYTDRMSP